MQACAFFPSLFDLPRRDRVTHIAGCVIRFLRPVLVGVGFVMRLRRHFGPAVPQVLLANMPQVSRLTLGFPFGFLSSIVCLPRSCEGVGI